MAAHEFSPDWCLAPSVTLREWLKENGLSVRTAAACAWESAARWQALRPADLAGVRDAQILAHPAHLLARLTEGVRDVLHELTLAEQAGHGRVYVVTRVSVQFWLNYEHNYRAGLAAGLTDVSD